MAENPWKDKYLAEAAKHDETVRKLAALTSHLNQVHEELGGTDTVLTLEAAQLVMVRLAACERVVEAAIAAQDKDVWEMNAHALYQAVEAYRAAVAAETCARSAPITVGDTQGEKDAL
jgi:hypothetical protein